MFCAGSVRPWHEPVHEGCVGRGGRGRGLFRAVFHRSRPRMLPRGSSADQNDEIPPKIPSCAAAQSLCTGSGMRPLVPARIPCPKPVLRGLHTFFIDSRIRIVIAKVEYPQSVSRPLKGAKVSHSWIAGMICAESAVSAKYFGTGPDTAPVQKRRME